MEGNLSRLALPRTPAATVMFLVALLAFAGPTRPTADNDTWWHLRTGGWILDHGAIPKTDPFSWTATGREWVTHEWAAQTIFAALHRAAGPAALLLLAGVLVGAAALLLQQSGRRLGHDPWAVAVASLTAVFLTTLEWSIRPHLFTLFFVALFCYLLVTESEGPRRITWLLVPATLVWANLHGAFVLGPLLIGAFVVGALLDRELPRARRLLVIGAAALVAGAINPAGPGLYLYPLHVAEVSELISEWDPVDPREPQGFVFTIATLGALGLLVGRRRTVDPGVLLAALAFVALGIAALKNVAPAAFPLGLLLGEALSGLGPARPDPSRGDRVVAGLLALAGLAGAIVLVPAKLAGKTESELLVERKYPVAATAALKELPPGRLANPYDWGGYVIYRARDFPVSIDGRNDMYGLELLRRQLSLEELTPGWDEFLADNDVDYVLWQRTAALAEALRLHDGWRLIHQDRMAVLFERVPLS